MLKRLISIWLLVCIICSLSVSGICADTDETADSADRPNLLFAKAMGLVDDSMSGNDVFLRGDLAKLVSTILIGDAATPDESGEALFSDVSYDYAPYVNTAVSAGIMNGLGNGTFAPYGEVTYIQLIKTMVCILGRSYSAEAYGGYPSGYFRVASELGLNDFAPPDMNYAVTVDGVSNVLKAMLECEVAYLDTNSNVEYSGEHYLLHYLGIDYAVGIIDRVGSTDKYNRVLIDYAVIDGTYYSVEPDVIQSTDTVGYKADVYYRTGSSAVKKIFYCEKHESGTVVLQPDQIESVYESEIAYSADGRDAKLRLASDVTVIYNNEVAENYDADILNPFLNGFMDGNVTFIDNNLDSKYDIVKITAYDTYVISRIDNGIIYNKYHGDVTIDTKKLSADVIVNVFMQPLEAEKLSTGDVISVMRNLDGEIANIIVTIEYYTGTVTALSTNGYGIDEIEIDNTPYKISPGFYASPNKDQIKPGMTVKVYFNPEGRICDIDTDESLVYRIGYLADHATNGGMDKTDRYKILETNGQLSEYVLCDKVSVEVGSVSKGIVASTDAVAYAGKKGDKIKRQPILYKTDSSQKINWIRYVDEYAPTTADGLYKYGEIANTSEYYLRSNSFGGHLLMGGSTAIFSVPSEAERDNDDLYTVISPSAIDNGTNFDPFTAYGTKAYNPMAEIMVFERSGNTVMTPSKYSDIFVVKNISSGFDQNGNEVAKVTGFIAGKEETHNIEPDIVSDIKPGDIIQLGGRIDSVVHAINKVFYCDTRQMGESFDGIRYENPTSKILYTDNRFVYGRAYYSDKSSFTLCVNGEIELSYLVGSFKIVMVDTTGRNITVSPGSASSILSELDYPSQGSDLFVHTSAITPKTIVIYR